MSADAQIFGEKVYLNFNDVDNDPDIISNVALSIDDCADLAVKLNDVRLVLEGRERLSLQPAMLEQTDLVFGMSVHSTFTDSGMTIIHFEGRETLIVNAGRYLDVERLIR